MNRYLLNDSEKLLDATIDVCLGWVCINAQHMWCGIFILLEVPDVLVRAERHHELTLLVLHLALFDRVAPLLFGLADAHEFSAALRLQVAGNLSLDLGRVQPLRPEALEENVVVDVDDDCGVDATEGLGARLPQVHVVVLLTEVVHEHPVTAVLLNVFLFLVSGPRWDVLHNLDLLLGGAEIGLLGFNFLLNDRLGLLFLSG